VVREGDVSDASPGRHVVLVDAGYLYAAAGQLVAGSAARRDLRLAAEPMIAALLARAAERAPGELLRMYWYDAARDRVPTVEQRQIAALPHVKVRLGNLNAAGQQKGVDAQLRADLELLARHRAVCDVILVAGDEDMVPAVEAAQAYGVRVHVWGIEPPYGLNQAERLVWEADTVDQLDAGFWRPYVLVDEPAEDEDPQDRPLVPTPADVFAGRRPAPPPPPPPATVVHVTTGPPHPPPAADRPGPERPEMEQIGARIAARWLVTRGRDNVADLLPGPVLPTVIDKELLVEAEEEISRSLRPYEEARRALRDGFWAHLHTAFGIAPDPAPADGPAPHRADPPHRPEGVSRSDGASRPEGARPTPLRAAPSHQAGAPPRPAPVPGPPATPQSATAHA
jgi:hypothetical protein